MTVETSGRPGSHPTRLVDRKTQIDPPSRQSLDPGRLFLQLGFEGTPSSVYLGSSERTHTLVETPTEAPARLDPSGSRAEKTDTVNPLEDSERHGAKGTTNPVRFLIYYRFSMVRPTKTRTPLRSSKEEKEDDVEVRWDSKRTTQTRSTAPV